MSNVPAPARNQPTGKRIMSNVDDDNELNPAVELAKRIAADESLDRLPDLGAMMKATPTVRRYYYAEAVRGLGARRFFFDKDAGRMVFEPDCATRIKAVAWLAGYDVGMPLQRILQKTVSDGPRVKSVEELAAYMAATPELADAFEREMKRQRRKGGDDNEKPAIPAG